MKNKAEKEEKVSAIKKLKEKLTEEEIKTRRKSKMDILICLIYAALIQVYFIILDKTSKSVSITELSGIIKISYIIFIFIAVLMFEIAYKKEKKNFIVNGIEFIFLSIHTLLIGKNITLNNILVSSYIWPTYYCLKAIIVYTNENRRRLNQISDISQIVKEEKPAKKVAKKRKT